VLWENVAYLVDDERRAAAFRALRRATGFDPRRILAARPEELEAVVAGMRPQDRAVRLCECAELALELGGGDLKALLHLPPAKALTALKRFPGIGAPGAEKILMACGALATLALESNGLRVLLRLGYGREEPQNYARSYRSVREALGDQLPAKPAALLRAHQLLRRHGQETCKREHPPCDECSLSDVCRSSNTFTRSP
jgi:endonuclease III